MKQNRSLCWFVGSASLCCLFVTAPTQAQIVPDSTLPDNSSVTTQGKTKIITGGTRAGSNLFHSFEQFSVPTNDVAYFDNANDIRNIISRVTGSSVSNIDGTLHAKGTANLFLLNPNGIIFNPNASLNIGGSFLASTASSINFADETSFSTMNSQDPQHLLTVSVPVGLQLGPTAAGIQVQGALLQVPSRKTLGLVGSDLALVGGALVAGGGRIELGSVAGPNRVSLTPVDKGWAFGYEGVQNFGDIQLFQGSFVDASGLREGFPEEMAGGDIQLQGGLITLTDESVILAATLGSQSGGEVFIRASDLSIESFSLVSTSTDDLGKGGNISIESDKLRIVDGGQVFTGAFGKGPGGALTVNASDVELVGVVVAEDGKFNPSGLLSQTEGAGPAGNLMLKTGRLTVQEGAQVSTTTFGAGRGGDLTVQASEIELAGNARLENGQLLTEPLLGLPFPSGLLAGTGEPGQVSTGDGGTLSVVTDRLRLQDGAVVQTSTFSTGDAGNLTIQASNSVELTGTARGSQFPTSIIAISGGLPSRLDLPRAREATGRGGAVNIKTGELTVQNGATVAVSSVNQTQAAEGAGTLEIEAQTILLDNQGALEAETASGNGGDTTLKVQDLLLLRRNSNISTTAGIAGTGGNGGNIKIDTNFIVAIPQENSDITANAFSGSGGEVNIQVQGGIFGLQPRSRQELQNLLEPDDPLDPKRLSSSDITAISQTNPSLSGQVTINTPDVDPSRGLANLPDTPVNVEVAQGCQSTGGKQAAVEFFNTGRGGLAPSPYEPLSSSAIWEDVPAQGRTANPTGSAPVSDSSPAPPEKVVEAQGWLVNKKGEVVLVAEVPAHSSQSRCRLH